MLCVVDYYELHSIQKLADKILYNKRLRNSGMPPQRVSARISAVVSHHSHNYFRLAYRSIQRERNREDIQPLTETAFHKHSPRYISRKAAPDSEDASATVALRANTAIS